MVIEDLDTEAQSLAAYLRLQMIAWDHTTFTLWFSGHGNVSNST
jgi:hypothetical protein